MTDFGRDGGCGMKFKNQFIHIIMNTNQNNILNQLYRYFQFVVIVIFEDDSATDFIFLSMISHDFMLIS
jgi:hypothetical protein